MSKKDKKVKKSAEYSKKDKKIAKSTKKVDSKKVLAEILKTPTKSANPSVKSNAKKSAPKS